MAKPEIHLIFALPSPSCNRGMARFCSYTNFRLSRRRAIPVGLATVPRFSDMLGLTRSDPESDGKHQIHRTRTHVLVQSPGAGVPEKSPCRISLRWGSRPVSKHRPGRANYHRSSAALRLSKRAMYGCCIEDRNASIGRELRVGVWSTC
jgi:hypothetical protein